ncbi:putative membrane protein [Plasmodium reichenowi]|uniref:Putative membrane protein n=1 Tax=Plasmodium reichenowi TaxID=5854 RepID=A0A151L500_PLARE|nr:putative membrane protein [Plasmodium reichenowi]KYN94014.1 putative membrane protein [Plasmodium reichenowi]
MIRTRLVFERIFFLIIFFGIVYFFLDFMTVYESSIRYLSFLLLLFIYGVSYILAIIPDMANSINYISFYKTRKKKVLSYSFKKDIFCQKKKKKKISNKDLEIHNLIDTNFFYMNPGVIEKEYYEKKNEFNDAYMYYLKHIKYMQKRDRKHGNKTNTNNYINSKVAMNDEDFNSNINNRVHDNINYKKDRKEDIYKNDDNYSDNNMYAMNKKENKEHKKYIIDNSEEFEKICFNDQGKKIKIKDKIIRYIELSNNNKKKKIKNNNNNNNNNNNSNSVNVNKIDEEQNSHVNQNNYILEEGNKKTKKNVSYKFYAYDEKTRKVKNIYEIHNEGLSIYNEMIGKHDNSLIHYKKKDTKKMIGSFLHEKIYLDDENDLSSDEDIEYINKKQKYVYLLLNKILCKNKSKRNNSYLLSEYGSNINSYTLDSFYDRNKRINKNTNFSKWHNLYLKCIINIKINFMEFCKNSAFIIADIIITLLLNILWLNVHKYIYRNNDDLDRGMFNWNTSEIPKIYNSIEGYLQYFILYDMCIKLFLFFSSNYILSFWFLLNLLNTPFFYILVSYFNNIKYKKMHWLYLSCPLRFLNFLRIEDLFGKNNNYNKLNIPLIKLSVQIFVMIYTYACLNYLIEQPCRGEYELYDYVFSGMQTVTTAALGKGTCFPFSFKGRFAHILYIFMTFTYIHYKIRSLKNYIIEEKKIYGKIPNIGSCYFVIIGHMKPIQLYVIINELQSTYNNLDEIIILTSLPIKFYWNIIRLLNKKNVCQISVCLYDLNKPMPLKIKKIISYSSGVFICNNIINTHYNIHNDMETLKRYNEINTFGPYDKHISIFLNNMCNRNILLQRYNRHVLCLNDLKMKLFAKTIDDCHGMFLLILLFFMNTPQKIKCKHTYILTKYFDKQIKRHNKKKKKYNKLRKYNKLKKYTHHNKNDNIFFKINMKLKNFFYPTKTKHIKTNFQNQTNNKPRYYFLKNMFFIFYTKRFIRNGNNKNIYINKKKHILNEKHKNKTHMDDQQNYYKINIGNQNIENMENMENIENNDSPSYNINKKNVKETNSDDRWLYKNQIYGKKKKNKKKRKKVFFVNENIKNNDEKNKSKNNIYNNIKSNKTIRNQYYEKNFKKSLCKTFLSYKFDEDTIFNSFTNYLNYMKGIKYNIYKIKFPVAFLNIHFVTIVQYMYMNYNTFVIGIIDEDNEVKLNPVDYIYNNRDIYFIILTDSFNLLHKITHIKKIELDWLDKIDQIKIKRTQKFVRNEKKDNLPSQGTVEEYSTYRKKNHQIRNDHNDDKEKKKKNNNNNNNNNSDNNSDNNNNNNNSDNNSDNNNNNNNSDNNNHYNNHYNNNYCSYSKWNNYFEYYNKDLSQKHREISKLRQEDNIYFNPVLNIFKVENYLEAYKIFKLKNKNESIKQSISQNKKLNLNVERNHSKSNHKNCTLYNEENIYNKNEEILLRNDKENKKKKKLKQKKEHLSNDNMKNHNFDDHYNNCNFIILIYWPQSLNTFLKILFQKREHNIIILSDQIPSYIYNNNLFPYRYNICYIQKSPLVLFNLILSGILVCEKCIIFKNYLKLDSYQNIVSYNEKTKNINFLEYMCEYNDSDLIIIYNNIENIFRRKDINTNFINYYIKNYNEKYKYHDYLKNKLSIHYRHNPSVINNFYTHHDNINNDKKKTKKKQTSQNHYYSNNIISEKNIKPIDESNIKEKKINKNNKNNKKKKLYLLIELNNALSIQYLNNDALTNVNILKEEMDNINKNKSHNLLFVENYKKQIQFFNYGNLLVENIYKKIEHIFIDNYFFYLYFLQFTSASIFIDELLYHLIGYTFPIKKNSLDTSTINSFIHGTYVDKKKKIKTDLILKNIHPKYHCRNFFFLFQKYLKKGRIIIGIYRCDEDNHMTIVIPCPQKNLLMHKNDKVYVLQSEYES